MGGEQISPHSFLFSRRLHSLPPPLLIPRLRSLIASNVRTVRRRKKKGKVKICKRRKRFICTLLNLLGRQTFPELGPHKSETDNTIDGDAFPHTVNVLHTLLLYKGIAAHCFSLEHSE